ncbi:cupredoxin domain-containing protein [Paenarthrobacter sp. DKR-5]|uniref:cupredoxin domain-containing protein n=1 Tax=Paenarthrobacter sp. DKR-5 TaxID=2835535 RepID=UPI002027B497|nr:cupredoxin domain-containing protein [Paenarthrobacter sp. DKR-5]
MKALPRIGTVLLLAASLTGLGTGLAGCAGQTADGGASQSAAAANTITIKGFAFQAPASVAPGSQVTVKNLDSAAHTVTADDGKSFDAQAGAGGGTGTFTAPSKPGSYPYHCTFHPDMHGVLVVK